MLSGVLFGMLSDPIRHQPVHELVAGALRSLERQPGQHLGIVNRIFQLQQALRNVFANLVGGCLPQQVEWSEPFLASIPRGASAATAITTGDYVWQVQGRRGKKTPPPPAHDQRRDNSASSGDNSRRKRGLKASKRSSSESSRGRGSGRGNGRGRGRRGGGREGGRHSDASSSRGSDRRQHNSRSRVGRDTSRRDDRSRDDSRRDSGQGRDSSRTRGGRRKSPRSPEPPAKNSSDATPAGVARPKTSRREAQAAAERATQATAAEADNGRSPSPIADRNERERLREEDRERRQAEHDEIPYDENVDYEKEPMDGDDGRVIPPLALVAQVDSRRLLTHNSGPHGHNGLPLSSHTAFARQLELDAAHAAAASAQAEEEKVRVRAVRTGYARYKIRDITVQPSMPWPSTLKYAVPQLLDSLQTAVEDILQQSDIEVDVADPAAWVRGWDRPLRKIVNRAIRPNQDTTGELISAFSDMFEQVNTRMDEGMTGGGAFKELQRLVSQYFSHEDRGDPLKTLNAFGVPTGEPFGDFLRKYRTEVNNITHYSSFNNLPENWIVSITRTKINDQYSVLMSDCFPGDLRTAPEPYKTLEAMWKVLNRYTTSKVKAENGEQFGSLSMAGLSLYPSASAPSQQRTVAQRQPAWVAPARSRQVAPRKTPIVQDVFCVSYAAWPLASDSDFETVFNVCETAYKTQLPPLWSPLCRNRASRAQAFRENDGKCLNCHLPDHSVRDCPHKFLNHSGVLNPDLGLLNDDSQTFRQWQGRMLSYRTPSDAQPASGNNYGGQKNSRGRSQWRRGRRRNNDKGGNYPPGNSQAQQQTMTTYQPPEPSSSQPVGQALVPAQGGHHPQNP